MLAGYFIFMNASDDINNCEHETEYRIDPK